MLCRVRQTLVLGHRQVRQASTYTLITPSAPRPRVAMVELNRPKALNALSTPLMTELNGHLQSLDKDSQIGAIVLTGGEKVFAGPSLESSNGSWRGHQRVFNREASNSRMADKQYYQVVRERFLSTWQNLTLLQKPVIAAVNGYAVCCDNRTYFS